MTGNHFIAKPSHHSLIHNRWMQLVFGIVCMAMIANLQYGWTLFVNPINAKYHWGKAAIQVSFTIFVLVETWLVPVEGYLVDRFGPRPVIAVGGVLAAIGWLMNAYADSLMGFYVAAVISGVGAGCVYGTAVGNALKWFPDKRGLAAGLTAAGFGAGAALTVIPIANMIHSSGYEYTFQFFGVAQGLIIFILALLLIRPTAPKGVQVSQRVASVKRDYSTSAMLKTSVFWVIYVLFVAVAAGGLMATAQIQPIAADYGIAKIPITTIFGSTLPLLTLVLSIDSLCNGFTRPVTGFISDLIGRENTMLVVFIGEGLALLGLMNYGHDPMMFLIFAPMVFLFWGEIFSIFPAICADTFGIKNAAGNAGALYTAKGTASLIVPIASVLSKGGNWNRVFLLSALIAIAAGLAAKFILAPMRARFIHEANQTHT
ncbi:MAG: oxalate/formate MFS antiporter [Betaproteobacteria bacterium]|nr:oxalate/formate MFS antiporter [Betaproteobacteria bacterium]MDE2422743.1 oxalate/formate MFS antiporter [Betaproteobacteria bacterium]